LTRVLCTFLLFSSALIGPVLGGIVVDQIGFELASFGIVIMFLVSVSSFVNYKIIKSIFFYHFDLKKDGFIWHLPLLCHLQDGGRAKTGIRRRGRRRHD
jgi:hypothetical protein